MCTRGDLCEVLGEYQCLFISLGTCQKLAGGRRGGDFQLSDENKMTLPR